MLDQLELAIHFERISMHIDKTYQVIRHKCHPEGILKMTFANGWVFEFYIEDAKWFAFLILAPSNDFLMPKSP